MGRYFLKLSYDGGSYAGWQIQPNARTIQGDIENAMMILFQKKVSVTGCGRTDAGVHAKNYIAHIDLEELKSPPDLTYKLNGILCDDIVIHSISKVNAKAHARFDASYRRYEYFIHTKKYPFRKEYSFFVPLLPKWDAKMLDECAQLLLEYSDFYSFCKSHTDVKTTICDIKESFWEVDHENDIWKYTISANRFLRGMVRLILGMQLNIAGGKMMIDDVKEAMESRTRLKRDWSVPARGLFLCDVRY